jgi:Xaa-Pro aminopeptidase
MRQTKASQDIQGKWESMQDFFKESNIDGCLISKSHNLYYLTQTIFNGYFYIPREGPPYCFIKRPVGLPVSDYMFYIRKPEEIPALLGRKMPKYLLMESDELSYNEYIRLKNIFQPRQTGNASQFLKGLRMLKTEWEIEQFKLSAKRHKLTYDNIPQCFTPGITDIEFQFRIEYTMRVFGSLGIFRTAGDMDMHMGSVLAGSNAENPSPYDFALGGGGISNAFPIGANKTKLKEGTSVMVDMAGNFTAYTTDMSRTYSIGKLPKEAYRIHQVAIDIERKLADMLKPGVHASELYNAAMAMVVEKSLTKYFMGTKQQAQFVGHGIGLQINEAPVFNKYSKDVLFDNMVVALEPKFVLPGIGPVGIEDSYIVTKNGGKKLTSSPSRIIDLLAEYEKKQKKSNEHSA